MVNPGDGNFTGTVVNSYLKTKKVKAPPYGNFYLFIYNNSRKKRIPMMPVRQISWKI